MIILSNSLTRTADEGALNIATSLIRRIRKADPETTVVTYERQAPESDLHLNLNKFLLNGDLIRLIRKKKAPVLYVPFPTRMLPMALRIFLLSRFARWGLRSLLVMNGELDPVSKVLLKLSRGQILTVSRQSYERFAEVIGSRAVYLKTGVDRAKFVPVDADRKRSLREKYGIPLDKKVVLHVGHLKAGRNAACLLTLDESWHSILVASTHAPDSKDAALRQQFLEAPNATLLESYLPDVQELYQLADVYLFPVVEAGNCIDVPLSALEAVSCGIPVAATPYGELRELLGKPGFYEIQSFEALAELLTEAVEEKISGRENAAEYDWEITVNYLLSYINKTRKKTKKREAF